MPPALTAVNPALGPQPPNPKYYQPQEVTLAMREKVFSLTGDDFTVKTVDGMDVMKCKAKLVSLHGKKKFSDMQDNEIVRTPRLPMAWAATGELTGADSTL